MIDNNIYILTLESPNDDEPQELYIGNSEGLKNYLMENSSDLFDWIMEEGYINPDNCDKFTIQTLQNYNNYLSELVTPPFEIAKINRYLNFANIWDNFRIELSSYKDVYTLFDYTLIKTDPETEEKEILFEGNHEEMWNHLIKCSKYLFMELYFSDYPNTDEEIKKECDRLLAYNEYFYQLMSNEHDPTRLTFPPSNITLEWR